MVNNKIQAGIKDGGQRSLCAHFLLNIINCKFTF